MNTNIKEFNPIWAKIPLEQQAWRSLVAGRPLVVEIGAGVGMHPIQYARHNPQNFIIAIERTTAKFQKMLRRAEHHPEITNLLCIHADAVQWITQNITAQEIAEYFLLYPNPYPKASQKNKRLMHMPFMQALLKTMQPNCKLTLATNEQSFWQEAVDIWHGDYDLQIISSGTICKDRLPRSHFEKKYLQRGETCYELVVSAA